VIAYHYNRTESIESLKHIHFISYRRKRKAKGGKGKAKSNGRVQHKGKGDQVISKTQSKTIHPISHSSQLEDVPQLSKDCKVCVTATDAETDAKSKAKEGGMFGSAQLILISGLTLSK